MGKLFARRPSPAMIVAMVAVILAVAGTATAALKGKDNKSDVRIADSEIVAKAGGLAVQSANTAQTAANAARATNSDQLGGAGPDAYQQRIRWAIVDASGTITAQSGGITIALHNGPSCPAGINNCDILDFGSSQAGKAINVTPNQLSTEISAWHCGGPSGAGATSCPVGDDANHIEVKPFDSTGTPENARYFITVIG